MGLALAGQGRYGDASRNPGSVRMPQRHPLASFVESQGLRIRVTAGRAWISEEGAAVDVPLQAGEEYVVVGPGLVRVEQEAIDRRGEVAAIALSRPCELPEAWKALAAATQRSGRQRF